MNYVHGKRRRRIVIRSTSPPQGGGDVTYPGKYPKPIVVDRPVAPRGRPPRALLLNSPPKLNPPAAGTFMPRAMVVSRLTRRPGLRPSVKFLSSMPAPPPVPPLPHMDIIRPLVAKRLVRTPALPTKIIPTFAKLPIPGPTKAIVVRRRVPRAGLPSRRATFTSTSYPPVNQASRAAVIIPRLLGPRTARQWIKVRSPVENRPLATLPLDPMVVGRFRGPLRGSPSIHRLAQATAKPIIARTTSFVIKPQRGLVLPTRALRPVPKTVPSAAQVTPEIIVARRLVKRPAARIIRPIGLGGVGSPQNASNVLPQTVTCRIIASLEYRQITIVSANGCIIQGRPPVPRVLDWSSKLRKRSPDKSIILSTFVGTSGPPDPPGDQPPDLIAAVIAMLKRQPAVVAALDEDP